MDDIRAVMDAAGSERAVLFGYIEGGPLAIVFAATYPDRVSGARAWAARSPASARCPTSTSSSRCSSSTGAAGTAAHDVLHRRQRSPSGRRVPNGGGHASCRRGSVAHATPHRRHAALPAITVPTLVIHRTGDPLVPVEAGEALAAGITGARFIERDSETTAQHAGASGSTCRRHRGVPDGGTCRGRTGPRPRERCCSPTSSTRRARAARKATPAGAPTSSATTTRPTGCRAASRPQREVHWRRHPRHVRRSCAARSAARRAGCSCGARPGSRSAPACTPARWRSSATTSRASRSTSRSVSVRAAPGQVVVSQTVRDLIAGSRSSSTTSVPRAQGRAGGVAALRRQVMTGPVSTTSNASPGMLFRSPRRRRSSASSARRTCTSRCRCRRRTSRTSSAPRR